MTKRMLDKVTCVVGAGQTAGETIGNGRAIAIRLAEEGSAWIHRLVGCEVMRVSA